jgi:transposase-like protein
VPQISKELGIHRSTLYKWLSNRRLQGEVVPASEKDPESCSAADKFTVVLETAGFNDTELSSYCRERGLFLEQVDRWRKAAQDQREIKQLKKELQRKEKVMAEMAAL